LLDVAKENLVAQVVANLSSQNAAASGSNSSNVHSIASRAQRPLSVPQHRMELASSFKLPLRAVRLTPLDPPKET
jgi:hypothetical protein